MISGTRKRSLFRPSQSFIIFGLAMIGISLALPHALWWLHLCLDLVAIALMLISVYFFYRFLTGTGPGTYSDIKAERRTPNAKI